MPTLIKSKHSLLLLQRMDSNHRSADYESAELPLLHATI